MNKENIIYILEALIFDDHVGVLEAMVDVSFKYSIDIELLAGYIKKNPVLVEMLHEEASTLNMLKKSSK